MLVILYNKNTEQVVIINKKTESKIKTRSLILEKSKEIFTKQGISKTSTRDICKLCGIAQGSLFLHFGTKDNLISTVFENEIKRIANRLRDEFENESRVEVLLEKYLTILEEEEDFFSVIFKEFQFFSEELKRQILSFETIIRNYFYCSIEKGIVSGIYKEVNITSTLAFLFATINYYLYLKEVYASDNSSVIKSKKNEICSTFMTMLLK